MKNHTSHSPKAPVIYKTDDGITVRFDLEFAKGFAKETHQECIALKEEKMGYGVFFTLDKDVAIYANDLVHKNILSLFWDKNEERITEELENAESADDVIVIAAEILVACSQNLIGIGIDSIDDLVA